MEKIILSRHDRAVTKMVADRVRRRGDSLAQISRATGIPPAHLAKLARMAKIRYRNQHATPNQIRAAMQAVTDLGLTFRAAGIMHGMSKTAVHRFVQRQRDRAVDAAGPVKFQTNREGWRCPKHGRIYVQPCVACQAEAATARD